VRVKTLLRKLLGLCGGTVITGWDLDGEEDRPRLTVWVRAKVQRRGRCGRCGTLGWWYDRGGRGDGTPRRWRHLDVGFAVCELVAPPPRVDCGDCGPTVAQVPWARHDSAFTRAFEDLVVSHAVGASKQAAADRYGISWRAVNNACVRVATEALGRIDLLSGLVAVAIDEVKYKKGQKYLTVVCDQFTGRVVWAARGRSKATVSAFFDALGERAADLEFVTCDGAEWIRLVVTERAPQAIVCLDPFHLISWATKALDDIRRAEWNMLRRSGGTDAAKQMKGLRWLLLRNWENLTPGQKNVIGDLAKANRRMFRGYQLKEELRDILTMTPVAASAALDRWLSWASRSQLAPFVKLARTIRHYRQSIEAAIEWRLTNGISESVNASIGRIRANARGFHHPEAFIAMIMLDRAGITPTLPWNQAS
jgi:transposase